MLISPHQVDSGKAGSVTKPGPPPNLQLPFPCGVKVRAETFAHAPALGIFRVPDRDTWGTPVLAAAAGIVNQSYYAPSGAAIIIDIDHGDRWLSLTAFTLAATRMRIR